MALWHFINFVLLLLLLPPKTYPTASTRWGVVTTGGIDFILLAEHLSILGTPVGKCRL